MKPQAFDLLPTGNAHGTSGSNGVNHWTKWWLQSHVPDMCDYLCTYMYMWGWSWWFQRCSTAVVCSNSFFTYLRGWWPQPTGIFGTFFVCFESTCAAWQPWHVPSNKGWSDLENLLWSLSKLTHSKAPHNPGQVLPNLCAWNLDNLDDLDLCCGRILEQVLEAAESDEFNAAVSASDVSFLSFES